MTDREIRIPIVEERAVVSTRERLVERVRVQTAVEHRDVLVEGELAMEALEIERRPVERAVDAAPPVREEGGATIISIVEERAVVTRHLFVVEELVIHRRVTPESFAIPLSLRRTTAAVERHAPSPHGDPQQEKN